MDIRQLVLVCENKDEAINNLCNLFDIKVAYHDPGIIFFGLENALLPVGNTFIEVISPVEEGTTAGRFLERRKGDGGYMVIIQVDNFLKSKEKVIQCGIDIVYESDDLLARAIHLHPKQLGGAILSLDVMDPPESWKWAGPEWQNFIETKTAEKIIGVQIQSLDPVKMKERWQSVLTDNCSNDLGNNIINLDTTNIEFIENEDSRGEGVTAFKIKVKDVEAVKFKASQLNLLQNGEIVIGGVKFLLS